MVGQWMNPLDNSLELDPDEKVQSLTIWLTPMGFSTECPGMEVGQVAAIHIATTHSRSVTFRSPEFHSLPPRKLGHQYQSDSGSGEELTAISWILNVFSEYVQAVVFENGRRAQILVPEQHPPFDHVQILYFETRSDNGCRETIVTAEAYFHDQAIIGLVLVYTSGKTARIGDLDVDVAARQTIHFARDAQIVGLSVVVTEHKLIALEFEVERNGREQPQYKKLRLSNSPANDPTNMLRYDWRDVWCKDRPSTESYQQLLARGRI